MKLVILGGPGSGKGTQSKSLSKCLEIPVISVGDVLRSAIALETELGKSAKPYVEKGELVPDELMIQFMRDRLLQDDLKNGWILDGYPRTAFQAEELDFLLEQEWQQRLDKAIYLEVSESTMRERSLKRGLADDQPDIISQRIKLFQLRTLAMLDYYGFRQMLLTISAEDTPQQVEAKIKSALA